jgi:integrase
MRKGEILGLQWKDIDLETGRITLHYTKNGDRRVVPVQGLALTTLQNLAPPFKNNPTYLEDMFLLGKKEVILLTFVVHGILP